MIFRFGEFELDEDQALLQRAGVRISIQPKAYELLLFLLRERHRVVHRSELLERLWADVVVSSQSVARAVNGVRHALGDDRSAQRFIHTLKGHGYRFVAPVEELPRSVAPTPPDIGASGDVFVGREPLMASLRAELRRAFAGETRVVLLEGQAGIGKTRAAMETSHVARAAGARVHTGWCQEGDATAPFQPWRQILKSILASPGWSAGDVGDSSARAEVERLLSGSEPAPPLETRELVPGEARLRLFEAIVSGVRAAAAEAPLLLVIDDLHAADLASLRLLEFLVRECTDTPLCVIATLRSEEVPLQHPAVRTLAELARRGRTTRLELTSLGRDDVARCIAAWTGSEPEPALVETVFDRSEGNPFFVRELSLWLAQESGGRARAAERPRVPPNVRDVVRRRLQSRSEPCLTLLRTAAIIGRDLDLEVLTLALGDSRDSVITALDEALGAQILLEENVGPQPYRFAHGLIQETLVLEQSRLRAAAVHRAVSAALEKLDGDDESRLAERARHACDGADAGTAEAAAACAIRAAQRAMSLVAYEEAALLYGRALAALAVAPDVSAERRCDVMLELGRALSHAGDSEAAEHAFDEAVTLGRRARDPRRTARAAVGLLGNLPALSPPSPSHIRLAEAATEELGPDDEALRVTALGRLALAWSAAGVPAHGVELADDALRRARTLGDRKLLAAALSQRATVALPTEDPATRMARSDEALAMLAASGDPRIELEGRIQRASALLELGRIDELEREIEAYAQLAAGLRHPVPRWYAEVQRALLHLLAGELGEAEQVAARAFEIGRRAGHPDAITYFTIQMTQIRYFQGRLGEMEEPLRRTLHRAPGLLGLRTALALTLTETDRAKEARRELDAVGADGFCGLAQDAGWLSNLTVLALVVSSLRDTTHAPRLYDVLLPYAERNVSAFLVASSGAASHFLALLSLCIGKAPQAIVHARHAVAANRQRRIAPWTAWSELVLARALVAGGAPGDEERAAELAGAALASAERMRMGPLITAARRALWDRSRGPDRGPAAPKGRIAR